MWHVPAHYIGGTAVHTWLDQWIDTYEGWNFNSGNYLFTTDTK